MHSVAANQLSGTIPVWIGNLINLVTVYLNTNQFTGNIPVEIGKLTKATYLNMGSNQLSGNIPSAIGDMASMGYLVLSSNRLSGTIPPSIGNLTKVGYLFLDTNNLSGSIPDVFTNMKTLYNLRLDFNQLTGTLPPSLGSCTNLAYLTITKNQLSGSIPSSFSNLTKMLFFYIDTNKLSGELPAFIGAWTNLYGFQISSNNFTGVIPSEIGSCTALNSFLIANNNFTGSFPSSISNCTLLVSIAAANNKFTSLPGTITSLPAAASIDFSNNELTSIPNFANQVNKANLSLTLTSNRLDFSQLEPLVGSGIKTVAALSQKTINDPPLTITLTEGNPLLINARPTGQFSTVTWEKQNTNGTWVALNNDQDNVAQTYTRTTATLADEGTYRWKMTNTQVTGITLTSDPIVVKTPIRFSVDNWAFQYRYDGRKRMTHKKVPGTDWVYMVYDDRDRLVMTQDGEQRKTNKWSFTKYDALNRPVMTGIYTHGSLVDQAGMSALISTTNFYESFNGDAANYGYTNTVFAATNFVVANLDVLSVTYYDNYNFLGNDSYLAYQSDELTGQYEFTTGKAFPRVMGLVTGSLVKTLNQDRQLLRTVNYYDDKYRVVQTISDNYLQGLERHTSIYDFTGKVMQSKTSVTNQEIVWKDLVNATVLSDRVSKVGNSNTWGNSGAASVQVIPANTNGWIEFSCSAYNGGSSMRVFGLSDTNQDNLPESIDYGIYHVRDYNNANTIRVHENGVIKFNTTNVNDGDIIRIERTGTLISYKRNGFVIYQSTVSSTTPLMADLSLNIWAELYNPKISISGQTSSITRTFTYDHAGRLLKTYHQINNQPEVLLSQNEYNELGQLIDKKLYSANNGSNFKQSLDYRYNIRGWLERINNSDVQSTTNQQEDDGSILHPDLFGMNLLYNQQDAGLGNAPQFNGNISAMKWSNNLSLGTVKENAYKYDYDAMNRILTSDFRQKKTNWGLPDNANAFNETGFKYDLNGNILKLTRNDIKGSSGTSVMDVLTYDYGSGDTKSNKLLSVSDAGNKQTGFIDGNTTGDDYSYDTNGSMVADKNKNISAITYNYLNLPEKVTKSNGEYIKYTYDATGRKLSQQVYNVANELQKKTDYAGEYIYENDVLQYLQHEEGRVVMNDRTVLYQNNGGSLAGITYGAGTTAATASLAKINNEDYIVVTNVGTGQLDGIYPIGSIIQVQPGEQYLLRAKGYRTGTVAVSFQIRGSNGTVDLAGGATLAPDAASERWTEQLITIPTGTTDLRIGLVWNLAAQNQVFYLNAIEIIKITPATEYQYHLKDHLGNVRMTFTSKDEVVEPTATLEDNHVTEDQANYLKYADARRIYSAIFDHSNGSSPGYAQRLSGTATEKMGLARSLAVMPGDKLKMEVYAKYFSASNSDITAFAAWVASMVSGSSVANSIIDGAGYANNLATTVPFTSPLDKSSESGAAPKAYLNWVVFDKDYNPILDKSGYRRISTAGLQTAGSDGPHEKLESPEVTIAEPGFAYIWLSNENDTPVEVYFDDFKVTQVKSPVVQMDDYYPFGLTFNSYQRENGVKQDYLYNGKEMQDDLNISWLDYGARMYNPSLSRFFNIDPLSEKYNTFTPYVYAANNPIRFIDYNGKGPGDAITGVQIVRAFGDGKNASSYQLTLYVNQPGKGGDRDTYEPQDPRVLYGRDAGHTFIGLKKINDDGSVTEKIFGWYPGKPRTGEIDLRTGDAEDRRGNKVGAFQDDNGDEYEVSKSYEISKEEFTSVLIEVLRSDQKTFNLNSNNCTDVAIRIVRSAGKDVKITKGFWEIFGISVGEGCNPGDLGEDLRQDPGSNKVPGQAKTADYKDNKNEKKSSSY